MRNTIVQEDTRPAAECLSRNGRRENRIRVHIPMRITYQGLLNEVSREGLCTDISEVGIGFETPAGLYVGEIVEVEFQDQVAVPFRFPVRLLYKTGNHYGAYYVSPESSSKAS